MGLLDSKVIETKFEKEIFIDQSSSIELCEFHFPKKNFLFYEAMVSIELMRIRDNEYYGIKNELFGIRMTDDLQTLYVIEPEKQNIFAIKNEQERQATNELIEYLLTESAAFKQLLTEMIQDLKQANLVSNKEIIETKAKLDFLERLVTIQSIDIKFPNTQKITA